MKLKLTIECVYEVDDQAAQDSYGTTDPAECARIDDTNFRDDPGLAVETLQFTSTGFTTKVEVV